VVTEAVAVVVVVVAVVVVEDFLESWIVDLIYFDYH